MGDQDDDARDFRALLEGAQAQLSIIADEPLNVTQTLLLTSINVNLALAIALGRQTGILAKQTTATVADINIPGVYLRWARDVGVSNDTMRNALRQMSRMVPDWRLKKIQAIKEVRVATTLGLKESKDLMDLTTQYPEFDDWWR